MMKNLFMYGNNLNFFIFLIVFVNLEGNIVLIIKFKSKMFVYRYM